MIQLLDGKELVTEFPRRSGAPVRAVDRVSFSVARGEILGIVGESGSGKSLLLRSIAGLCNPSARGAKLRALRRKVQILLQDPYTLLPHGRSVIHILTEPLAIHGIGTGPGRRRKAVETLESEGLPTDFLTRVPGQLSGASASASPSPGRWCPSPSCCCSTSRFRRSTCRYGRRCSTCWQTCARIAG